MLPSLPPTLSLSLTLSVPHTLCPFLSCQVHHAVYDSIEKQGSYNSLRSTHHFGGLAWYLVQRERVTELLRDMVQRKL